MQSCKSNVGRNAQVQLSGAFSPGTTAQLTWAGDLSGLVDGSRWGVDNKPAQGFWDSLRRAREASKTPCRRAQETESWRTVALKARGRQCRR